MRPKSTGLVLGIICALYSVGAMVTAGAFAQRASVPKEQDKIALGASELNQMPLLKAMDKNGKVSKQEWMKFMEAEFDRLDKDKSGELDPKEVAESRIRVSGPFSAVSK